MWRMVIAVAAVLVAAACSGTPPIPDTSAGTPGAGTPAASPQTSGLGSLPSPAPVPTTGPGSVCHDEDVRTFLREIATHSSESGLDTDAPFREWLTVLRDAAPAAAGPTLEHIQQGITALEAYRSARAGSAAAHAHARTLVAAAAELADTCGLSAEYTITVPDEAGPERTRRPAPEPTP
ncbi:hypothetical protein HS041_26920 [Planomonospora sp. ID67723]|uniref:hypothetical protein n=1 Tax=Planomonospora sp. ID67723 TaxID=2738134 RepID=UPI0018C384EC|nr:hypothetical protein [Planomonospora sp. ID67723]MBG0831383.1 hypothetical protein [Planomonospora sp. ID67723]